MPLPQTDLAMLVGQDSGMPPCYRKVAGNIADVSTVGAPMRDMEPSLPGRVRLVTAAASGRPPTPTP